MAEVVKNTSQLPRQDVQAMAICLKHVPAVHKPAPGMPEPNRTGSLVMLRNAVAVTPTRPTSPEQAITQGGDACVVATKPVWLEQAGVGGSVPEQGKLLGGAPVHVAARSADTLQLVLKGWQMEGAPSVVYQSKGHRVMLAVLDQAAATAVTRGKPDTNADTGQSWIPVEVTLWSHAPI